MKRRACASALALTVFAARGLARAQTARRVHRVGILRPSAAAPLASGLTATGIPNALRDLGYVEGSNLVLERRHAGGEAEQLPVLEREPLVNLKTARALGLAIPQALLLRADEVIQ